MRALPIVLFFILAFGNVVAQDAGAGFSQGASAARDTVLSGNSDTIKKESHFLTFNLGAYNVFRPDYMHGLFQVEYFPPWEAWFFYPFAGAFVNTNSKAFLYAGVTIPFFIKKKLFFRISFAPGLYTASDEKKDLGYWLEFQTAIKLGWELHNGARIGLQFSHISNANLHRPNPGAETLVVSYEMPF